MVALRTERRVFLWRLSPSISPASVDRSSTLPEIIKILEAEKAAGRARAYIGGGRILEPADAARDEKNQLYIAEIKEDPQAKAITILMNRGDPTAVSPAFIDSETSAVRVEHPHEKEAPGWSAHLVISVTEDNGKHRACFEQMPHVSSALVIAAIDRIVALAVAGDSHFIVKQRVIVNKKPVNKSIQYRPVLTASRIPSENLTRDLERGVLAAITLTKSKSFYSGPGASDLVKRQEEKVVIRTERAESGRIRNLVTRIVERAKEEHFETISFRIEQLPGNATNNPTLELADLDALEQLYVRAQRLVDFPVILEACYASICSYIDDRMKALVNDNSLW